MGFAEFVTIAFDGLVYSSYLFIVSVGLTIIFGVMKILNVTHGAFYAWGAYVCAWLISTFFADKLPWDGTFLDGVVVFAMIFGAAIVVGIALGLILERFILQHMYHRDEVLIVLATFGCFLILEDVILHVFGVDPYFANYPQDYLGYTDIAGIAQSYYNISLIALALLVAFGCWFGINRTKWGRLLIAVIYDREVSEAMGINVKVVYIITFCVGAVLGALGGAYIAPTVSVAPGFGADVIVLSFAVVVVGGMGSIPGAVIGSLIVGMARAIAVHKLPEAELFVVYLVMAGVLIVRPEGLFAPAKARKI